MYSETLLCMLNPSNKNKSRKGCVISLFGTTVSGFKNSINTEVNRDELSRTKTPSRTI